MSRFVETGFILDGVAALAVGFTVTLGGLALGLGRTEIGAGVVVVV